MRPALGTLILLALPSFVLAGRGNDFVHARLIVDTATPSPNQIFHIGVLFDIEPGWHIYWINPGDSGLPTKLKLHLPPGYTAGPIQFPLPTKLSLPGDIVNYAYEKQVMLIVPVTAPATVDPSVDVAVDASWLVCQEVCLPGKTTLSSKLSDAARPELFEKWTAQLPVDHDPRVSSVKFEHDVSSATVHVAWSGPAPADVQFFPPSADTDTASISCVTKGSLTTIHYHKTLAGPVPTYGLMEFTVADGRRIGINLKPSP